jgi:hypothetical protein
MCRVTVLAVGTMSEHGIDLQALNSGTNLTHQRFVIRFKGEQRILWPDQRIHIIEEGDTRCAECRRRAAKLLLAHAGDIRSLADRRLAQLAAFAACRTDDVDSHALARKQGNCPSAKPRFVVRVCAYNKD